jgi:hypothetical protein
MNVSMMLVVHMSVVMVHHLMPMIVLVPLSEVQPHAKPHERSGNDEECRWLLPEDNQ